MRVKVNNKSNNGVIITRTPMRITLGGGGTDVYWYSHLRGGSWISAAINKYVYVLLNRTDDSKLLKTETEILKECLLKVRINTGIRITTISEVSSRSGLGGSGAFEVGLLNALYTLKGRGVSPIKLAEEAVYIEAKKLKKPIGPQDHYITALGGIKYFEVDKKGNVYAEDLKLDKEVVTKLENNLLYFSTGIQRDTDAILGEERKRAERIDTSSKVIEALDKIKSLGLKVKQYLLDSNIDKFGKSLHEHWLIKKTLSKKVSNPKIDQWYNLGLEAGALGGKIMGAGGGGWFVFYVNKNKDKFIGRMSKSGLIPQQVNFDWEGTKVLVNLS